MIPVFDFIDGDAPLLVSVPHDGDHLCEDNRHAWSRAAIEHSDRDWHVAKLYDFATGLGASMIVANYSRYVIDLNRPPDDEELYPGKLASGLVPHQSFDGQPLYLDASLPEPVEVQSRLDRYWRPYHDRIEAELNAIREKHGYALLWDAHSIRSRVLSLFDGELPVLNVGTYGGASCAADIADAVRLAAQTSDFSVVINGRFQGGYITRYFGQPDQDIHAIQLELAQRAYMHEGSRQFDDARADELRGTLKSMLQSYLDAAEQRYG